MKAIAVKNGKWSIILIPEDEGDDATIKAMNNGAKVSVISPGSNTQILNTPISKGLMIEELDKSVDSTKEEKKESDNILENSEKEVSLQKTQEA